MRRYTGSDTFDAPLIDADIDECTHRDRYRDLSHAINDGITRLERGEAIADEFQKCSQYSYQGTDESRKKEIQDTYGEDIFFDRDEADRGRYHPLTNREMSYCLSHLFSQLTSKNH